MTYARTPRPTDGEAVAAAVDRLPPTEYLLMGVLAARARCGEHGWAFPARLGMFLARLASRGLLAYKASPEHGNYLAWLTDAGRTAVLSGDYTPPILSSVQAEETTALAPRLDTYVSIPAAEDITSGVLVAYGPHGLRACGPGDDCVGVTRDVIPRGAWAKRRSGDDGWHRSPPPGPPR